MLTFALVAATLLGATGVPGASNCEVRPLLAPQTVPVPRETIAAFVNNTTSMELANGYTGAPVNQTGSAQAEAEAWKTKVEQERERIRKEGVQFERKCITGPGILIFTLFLVLSGLNVISSKEEDMGPTAWRSAMGLLGVVLFFGASYAATAESYFISHYVVGALGILFFLLNIYMSLTSSDPNPD